MYSYDLGAELDLEAGPRSWTSKFLSKYSLIVERQQMNERYMKNVHLRRQWL